MLTSLVTSLPNASVTLTTVFKSVPGATVVCVNSTLVTSAATYVKASVVFPITLPSTSAILDISTVYVALSANLLTNVNVATSLASFNVTWLTNTRLPSLSVTLKLAGFTSLTALLNLTSACVLLIALTDSTINSTISSNPSTAATRSANAASTSSWVASSFSNTASAASNAAPNAAQLSSV